MLLNPWYDCKLRLKAYEQLEFARAARERFFPFVFDAPIYDDHDIMDGGGPKNPVHYDQRHLFQWKSKEQLLAFSMICNREYLCGQYVEENQEILHLSLAFYPGVFTGEPIHTSLIEVPTAIEVPILIIPKVTWSLKMTSDKVFHFHVKVADAKREIENRKRN